MATVVDEEAAAKIARTHASHDRNSRPLGLRILLMVVAVEVLVGSIWDLFGFGSSVAGSHAERHLGAFTMAYGALLLVVAVRPARARTALPVAGVLAAALVVTAITDLVAGRVPLVGEAMHIPEVVSVVLVWMLAVPRRRWPFGREGRGRHRSPSAGAGRSRSLSAVGELPEVHATGSADSSEAESSRRSR